MLYDIAFLGLPEPQRMIRYLSLDIVFLLIAFLVAIIRRRQFSGSGAYLAKVAVFMLVLTLIFDNVIIILHIVSYDPSHLLGIYLYKAPIEDFAYTIAGVLIIPALWKGFK